MAREARGDQGGAEPDMSPRLNALNVLAKVDDFEIGGLAGIMLGAAARRCPVVADGIDLDRRCAVGGGPGAGRTRISSRGHGCCSSPVIVALNAFQTGAGTRSGIGLGKARERA